VLSPQIYWVPAPEGARLAVMPCPRGHEWLLEELSAWRRDGVDSVISLLEDREVRDLGLTQEARLCRSLGMSFLSFPIPDRGVPPSVREVALLVERVRGELSAGVGVGIHCLAGIGRSPLLAACVLLKLGVPQERVFPILSQARGFQVPDTPAQVKWLGTFLREGNKA